MRTTVRLSKPLLERARREAARRGMTLTALIEQGLGLALRRLTHMFPNAPWTRLKLFALDATDLALSKLERNAEPDREDFLRLARAGLLDLAAFKGRYFEQVRPYLLGNLPWHDKTVELWLTMASIPLVP